MIFLQKEQNWRNLSWIYLISAGIGMPAFKGEEQQQQKKEQHSFKINEFKGFLSQSFGL